MGTTPMFVIYPKTKEEFISSGLATTYNNSIVVIKGDESGKGSCIYTHGMYIVEVAEFIKALNYVKGVNVGGTSYNVAAGGGYIAFDAVDPSTVSINAGSNGISIGLTKDFVDKVNELESKTDIVASQIFLELHTDLDDFQVFSHKSGYEEHNRTVCQRLIENCFTNKTPNNEVFFVTINGLRDGIPYMETAILESQAEETVRASFVKGNGAQSSSIAASIDILSIDAEVLKSYAESGDDAFYWKYSSTIVPSIDAIGSEGESDIYVTEFTFEQITTNGAQVNVSPELVEAIYNKKIIVIPGYSWNYIATNTYSAPNLFPIRIRMQIVSGPYIYDVTLSGKGAAPQTIPTYVRVTNLLSGTLNTINGASIAAGADMQLVSSISLNGKTYTPTKGAVDLGNIEGEQQFKTIFGREIVGEGDVLDDYSMEITDVGTYAVNSIVNPRIAREGNIFPLVVDEFVQINYGPTLNVRISSDGTLTVSGSAGAIGGIPTSYLASGVIPEEYMPKNVATLDDIQQADFDETDVESKAYIKNRSHYFKSYVPEQQLIVDDTTVGTKLFTLGEYFKLGGAIYKAANMVGVEFNCQNSGAPVFVTVGGELDSDGNPSFYLRHISGNSSAGAPIMFSPSGTVKTIDSVFIPDEYVTKTYLNNTLTTNIKTINGQSIIGSGDIVISGGGGSSSGGSGVYSEINHGTSDTTFTLTPNTFHVWDEVASLTLDLGSETASVANEFLFQFTSGGTATSLTLPDDIRWANDSAPTIVENKIYQVSILKRFASVLEFSNEASSVPIVFYVNGITYNAMSNMTWEEWVNSEYDTNDEFFLDGNEVNYWIDKADDEYIYVYSMTLGAVTKSDIIVPEHSYFAN